MSNIGTEYLFLCRDNYLRGITPSNNQNYSNPNYVRIIEIAQEYFAGNKIGEYKSFFQEYQYLVSLWTAHMILEHGNPDSELKAECIEIIMRYTNSHNIELVNEEKQWLLNNRYFIQ